MDFENKNMPLIWLVDDETDLALSYSKYLKAEFESQIFSSAEEALKAFDTDDLKKPTLIVTDLKMPGTDGLSMIQQLRKRDIQTPVLLMSGFAEKDDLFKAMENDVSGFLEKPFEPELLLKKIQESLQRDMRVLLMKRLIVSLLKQTSNYSELLRRYEDRYSKAENRVLESKQELFTSRTEVQQFIAEIGQERILESQIESEQKIINNIINMNIF